MPKMTSPRAKGKKVAIPFSSKIKKETDGIKGDYEKPNDAESTLKMMLRQAHEIHKGFYKRNQGLRKSQSFEDLKNQKHTALPRVSGGKGDVGGTKEHVPHKKKLKDPVKLGKTVKAPLSVKITHKKIRKNSSKDAKVEIRKLTSASSFVGIMSGGKNQDDSGGSTPGKLEKKVEERNQNDIKILYEKETKNEEENSGKNVSEKRVLSPEELLININKIWEERDKNPENFSKTDAKFIEGLLEIAGHKVLKKDEAKKEDREKPTLPLKNPQDSKNSPDGLQEIWRNNEEKEEEEEEIFEMAIGEPAKELKSYRELKNFVNDELIRIWKPYEKIEIKEQKELKKQEVEEVKPGRIIVKPNPTSYLEKRALYAKTNCTSLISKFDQEKKIVKDSKIVKRLENAFETLNAINWENSEKIHEKISRVKEEDLAKSILQRIDDHKKVIVGEINRTEKKINEKFNLGKKKAKVKGEGDKSLEVHFKRSLEDVQSADGLLLETEKECQEITQKIFEEYKNKKFRENTPENYPKDVRYKFDSIDRKIQKDFKKFGLINFKKTNRIKLRDKDPEKVSECSGWRKKKSQPSRSISRSIGSAGGTDEQGLPPISLQDEPIIPAKMLTDTKPLDTGSAFDQSKVLGFVDKAEDTQDISFDQVLDMDDGWDETLEDPGGSTIAPEKPIFVDLEELRYRKGDPSFRYYKKKEDIEEKKVTTEEIEAMRRKRELQRILAMDKDYVVDDDKDEKSSRKSKDSNTGKAACHRTSIIVNHITSGERIDDNEKVLGHASKLVVKEDKEVREKKKMFAQSYYKQGMRRGTEPAIPQSQFSDIDMLKRTFRKSEPINIKRTESKDVECQTDTTDTSDDDMDLYSLEDGSIN